MTSPPGLPGMRPPLVGRINETQVLRWALDELAAGRGVVAELTGDPGIGKTRLLTELTEEAARRGFPVLRGGATEFERDLPFQVFIDALGDRYRREPGGELDALFSGRGAPGSGAERFRVYGAVRDLLAGWAGSVLLLDDMHWADPGAVELAEYLVRRPPAAPLLLMLAHRGRQIAARLAGTLANGVELGSVVRLELGPLTPSEAAELAGVGLDDGSLDDRTVQAICAESGGNPLYLLAATASLRTAEHRTAEHRTGETARTPTPITVSTPNRLEAVLLAELAPLSPLESLVASAAAVAGEQFGLDALTAIAGLGRPDVESAVGGLTRRDVLRPAASGATFAFRHPVLRRLVYRSADPAWCAAAHRRALADLQRRGAPAAELAHHVAASPGRDAPEDREILLAAAQAAMSSAPATAAHWLRVALRTLPDDAGHRQPRIEILLRLTRALGVSGRSSESRDLLNEILRLVPLRPAGPRVAAVTFCATMERLLARYDEARTLLEAELASNRAAATTEGVALAIEYGQVALLSARFPSAREVMSTAVARARRGHRIRAAHALAITGLGEAYEGNIARSREAVDAAAALVDRLSDAEVAAEPECLSVLGWAEVFAERYADAGRHFARGVSIIRNTGAYHVLPHLLLGQCQIAGWCGPLDRAIALSEEAEEVARHINSSDVLGLALGQRAFALTWAGGPGSEKRAAELAQEAVAVIPPASVWWTVTAATFQAVTSIMNGDPVRCLQVMTTTGGGQWLPRVQPSIRPVCFDLLTAAALMAGDSDRARAYVDRTDAESRKLGLAGQRGFALRARGYLLSADGRHEEAAATFRAAAELLETAGVTTGQGWALAFAAASAADAGRTREAQAMADRACSLARAIGSMTILNMAEGTRLRLAMGVTGPAQTADPLAGLTGREREIARLAATGRTSRDIAAQLCLSPRTVDTHLSRAYRKLGVPSRAALASLVAGNPAGPDGYAADPD